MSEPPVWFEYHRPHQGKLSARPVHPIGWLLLLGAPIPALALGLAVGSVVGRPFGAVIALVTGGISLLALFRAVVSRGRPGLSVQISTLPSSTTAITSISQPVRRSSPRLSRTTPPTAQAKHASIAIAGAA